MTARSAIAQVWRPAFQDQRNADGTWNEISGDNVAALQTATGSVLIAGCASCHPFVACDLFEFGNSDGSSDPTQFDSSSGESLLMSLCEAAETYAYDQVH